MLVNGAVYAAGQRLKAIELDHAALPLLEFIGKLHGGRVPPVCYSV